MAALKADVRPRVPLVLWLVTAFCVALMGPFGSYGALSFGARVLFWFPVLAVCLLAATAIRAFVHGTLGLSDFKGGPVLITLLICLVICPPLQLLSISVRDHYVDVRTSLGQVSLLMRFGD